MDFMTTPGFKEEGWTEPGVNYLAYTIALTVVVYLWETLLDVKQHARFASKKPPSSLVAALERCDQQSPSEHGSMLERVLSKFPASQAYSKDKSSFGLLSSGFFTLQNLAQIGLGFYPYLWVYSLRLGKKFGWEEDAEIKISLLWSALSMLLGTVISLPFSMYSAFVIEERHGFNKQTLGLFLTDKVKQIILSFLIGGPILALVLKLMEWGGKTFYIYVGAFLFVVSIVMITIYPVLIAPLFNEYTPLEEGELKKSIEELASKVGFPLKKLFVVDGSKRSNHSNAYMYGFGNNKRIVLFDSLVSQATVPEIVAILGHEIGHWKLSHTLQGLFITQVYIFVALYSYGVLMEGNNDVFLSFGFVSQPRIVGLTLFFATIWAPVDHLLNFLMTLLSRHNEFSADAFAKKLGFAAELKRALTKLQVENLSVMDPDPLYSAYHYSHPPLVERLGALESSKED
ncbi:unnamed protein product [Chrysoparadoxa australica]